MLSVLACFSIASASHTWVPMLAGTAAQPVMHMCRKGMHVCGWCLQLSQIQINRGSSISPVKPTISMVLSYVKRMQDKV